MAKVDGPLFSFGASGSIADTMTFSRWKGRPYVRQHVIPANPKSAAQVGTRVMFKFLSQAWAGLSGAAKESWDARASARSYSAFNGYQQVGMSRWSEGKAPSQEDPAEEVLATAAPTAADVSGDGTERTLSLTTPADTDQWGVVLYGADGESPTGAHSEAIAVVPWISNDTTTYTILGVPANYDTFSIRVFTLDGVLRNNAALPIE